MPDAATADDDDLVGVGADLEPATVLHAYRNGLFPMPLGPDGPIGWWSPDPRGVLELEDLHVSRSLRRTSARFEIRVDSAFDEVIDGCADPKRPHGWIDSRIRSAYRTLFDLGWAHSIEVFDSDGLAGGLYGLAIGGLFAGESMFHHRTDASKTAVMALVELLGDGLDRLIDVQWPTPHLETLGVTAMPRTVYLERLGELLHTPEPTLRP